ncbi:sensor histidine kinase [Cohnella hongkongensis]|uniref:Sensor histidine kinase n=1 Tax=Cohnella hongkongensis TaxID=178337 RepID=A0ABV9F9T8_9BACL
MFSKVNYYMNTIDSEFNRIIKQEFELMYDDDLSKLSVAYSAMNNIERMQSTRRLVKRLEMLKSSNRYVKDIAVYVSDIGSTLATASSTVPFPTDEFFHSPMSKERLDTPIRLWNDRMFISFPFPERAFLGDLGRPSFVVHVEIHTKELLNDLNRFVSHEEGGTVLADSARSWILSDRQDSHFQDRILAWLDDTTAAAQTNGAGTLSIQDRKYMVTYQRALSIGAVMLTYTPEERMLQPILKYKRWYWLLLVVSLFIILIFSYSIYSLIHRPLVRLLQSFRSAEMGKFQRIGSYRFKDEFSYLYFQFNQMIERLQILIHEVYEQRYRAQLAELRKLQSQINPHFFYNSFFILYRMAKSEDYESVMRLTKLLGEYYQFITRDGHDIISLDTEVRFARTYAEIQNIRFSRRIALQFPELPATMDAILVPRLTLQPLIENAYNHGLEKKSAGGLIRVLFVEEKSQVTITVEDNGEEMNENLLAELRRSLLSPDAVAESTGMINIHRRIRIHCKNKGGLSLSRSELGGLQVTVAIPKEENEHV